MEAEMKLPASMSEIDIIDFIVSRNMERRDLNQGAQEFTASPAPTPWR
jgi:hypothetical protein